MSFAGKIEQDAVLVDTAGFFEADGLGVWVLALTDAVAPAGLAALAEPGCGVGGAAGRDAFESCELPHDESTHMTATALAVTLL